MDKRQFVLLVAVFMVVVTVMLSIPMIASGQTSGEALRTCTARGEMTIGKGGEMVLETDYGRRPAAQHVMRLVRACKPWRS